MHKTKLKYTIGYGVYCLLANTITTTQLSHNLFTVIGSTSYVYSHVIITIYQKLIATKWESL